MKIKKDGNENGSRKSPWRWAFAVCAVLGAMELLGSLAAYLVSFFWAAKTLAVSEAATIGIIGGADGPTAIFVTTPGWTAYVVPVLLLAIGITGFFLLNRQRKE